MKQTKPDNCVSADRLAAGLAEIHSLLARISQGDTSLRVDVTAEVDSFGGLKILCNQLADHIQKLNEDAHEMAIGLCEHYDTLNRIALGDFQACAAENSQNELVAKLGELINKESTALTGAISRVQLAEAEKQSQLNFLQTLIDTIPSPIFFKDLNYRYLGCNKAFETYLGFSRDQIVGKTLDELWPAELADRYRLQDRALFENPGSQALETPIRYADGTLRDVICNKATFFGSDGSLGGLVGVILDITERKRAEEALVFQNILLSTQQEASIDGILVVDENARILSFNRRFVEIMGIPSQLLETREDEPVLKYVTDRMREPGKFLEKVKYLYQNRQMSCRDEISLCDGKILDRYTVPLLGDEGRYYGRLWSFRDITERKAAEDQARHAYQQLLDIVEFLPDATFVVDKGKRVIAWNRAIEDMTGLKKEDVIGQGDQVYSIPFYGERRPILIDLIDEDPDVVDSNYTNVRRDGRSLLAETHVPSLCNGRDRYLWGIATPLFDKQGNQVGGIESIRDITEHRLAEQERSRLEAQLHHARMMESFMVRLGHDLKTPLTPLFALLPLVRERVTDPDLKNMLDICCKNTVSIKELTDKTRMLVTLYSDIRPYELETVSLYSVVQECLDECSGGMTSKKISCHNEIDPAISVLAAPAQLHELFTNLILNAARYSHENGRVRIVAEECHDTVTVAVIDDGIGLAPQHLESIFDEFFKVDESRHDLEASGLGLSICKRIVQNHHGRIWAESAGLGKGTSIFCAFDRQFKGIQKSEKEMAPHG